VTTERIAKQRGFLYVDATIAVPYPRGVVRASFGPFSDRAVAERALTTFIARENALSATIRDPDA
jgi:hypothetical protein